MTQAGNIAAYLFCVVLGEQCMSFKEFDLSDYIKALEPTGIKQSRKRPFYQHFRDSIHYSNSFSGLIFHINLLLLRFKTVVPKLYPFIL